MCRSIKVLRGMQPPATRDDIRAAALQFVRKVSGYHHPSRAREAAFERAVSEVALAAERLLADIAPPASVRSAAEQAPAGAGANS